MPPNTQKRGNTYFFRRKIPVDLISRYPRKVMLVSLGTSDYETAKTRAAEMTAKTNREFAELRGVKSDGWKPPENFYLSREELENAEGWQREYATNRDHHKAVDRALREARKTTDKLLAASGLPNTEQLALARVVAESSAGSAATPPKADKSVPLRRQVTRLDASPEAWNLRHAVPSWIRRNSPKPASVGHANRAIDLFEQACGVVRLRELTKAHGAKFVAFLLEPGAHKFKAKTAGNYAALITAILNVAVKDDVIERNPLDLSFDKSRGAETREPWTEGDLKIIFGHVLFSNAIDAVPEWNGIKPVDARALLLMLLHTGARIGEIAQLRRRDFVVREGVTAIRITAEAGTVKTKESERVVPLADHLLADPWFGSWLAKVMDGTRPEDAALASTAGRKRGASDAASKWFKAFRETVGLPAGRLNGTHKFRHWIRSALAAKDVGIETADAITGHAAQGSSGRVSYTSVSLPTMLAALNRLTYPRVSGV